MYDIYRVVNVVRGSLTPDSKCCVLPKGRCKRKATHMLFCDDGRTSSSRLFMTSCEKHLAKAVDLGWKLNKEDEEKYKRKKIETLKQELQEAKAETVQSN